MDGWTSVDLTLPAEAGELEQEVLSAALFEVGSGGIETRDAVLPVVMVASFPPDIPPETLPERVEAALEAAGVVGAGIVFRSEAPIDWATHWRTHFTPLGFGALWVVPTWLEPPPEARYVLRMDPGMAFGTGSHATTALCLEQIVAESPVRSILDVGTGTGILAMGALLLGAERAVGTDEDPDALAVARENAALNGLAGRLELTAAEPDELGRFDLVVANILREPLIVLAPRIARAVAGRLLLSGILDTQVEDVARVYEALGFTGRRVERRGEWALIALDAPRA